MASGALSQGSQVLLLQISNRHLSLSGELRPSVHARRPAVPDRGAAGGRAGLPLRGPAAGRRGPGHAGCRRVAGGGAGAVGLAPPGGRGPRRPVAAAPGDEPREALRPPPAAGDGRLHPRVQLRVGGVLPVRTSQDEEHGQGGEGEGLRAGPLRARARLHVQAVPGGLPPGGGECKLTPAAPGGAED